MRIRNTGCHLSRKGKGGETAKNLYGEGGGERGEKICKQVSGKGTA